MPSKSSLSQTIHRSMHFGSPIYGTSNAKEQLNSKKPVRNAETRIYQLLVHAMLLAWAVSTCFDFANQAKTSGLNGDA